MPRPITTGTKRKWNREHREELLAARKRYNDKVKRAATFCRMLQREFLGLPLEDRRAVFARLERKERQA